MLQLIRISALVAIVYIALGAVGRTNTSVTMASYTESGVCQTTTAFDRAIDAVDYAEAVLIANGEIYTGQSSDEVRVLIAALPRYVEQDGISSDEAAALDMLLQYGRQLAYASATEELERQLDRGSEGIRVASADAGASFELLRALRGGC